MPANGLRIHCVERGCRELFIAKSPGDRGRCPKCAAYHRGRVSAEGLARRVEQQKAREARLALERKKRHRREVGIDATEEREIAMRERAAVVNDMIRGK